MVCQHLRQILTFNHLCTSKMIWFLTFGKNGSAGMPAVPATILMSGLTQIGRELTGIKAFEVVEIWRFEVVGLVEICCDIMYSVRIGLKM